LGGGRCGAVCDPRRLPADETAVRRPSALPLGNALHRAGAGPSLGLLLGASAWDEEAATATAEEDWVQDRADPRVLTNGVPAVYPVRSTTGTTARARPVGLARLARPAGRDLLGGEERCVLHAHSRRPGLRWDTPPTTMLTPPTPCASRTDTAHGIAACDVRQRHAHRTACDEPSSTPLPPSACTLDSLGAASQVSRFSRACESRVPCGRLWPPECDLRGHTHR
jgi:hypothetical protein